MCSLSIILKSAMESFSYAIQPVLTNQLTNKNVKSFTISCLYHSHNLFKEVTQWKKVKLVYQDVLVKDVLFIQTDLDEKAYIKLLANILGNKSIIKNREEFEHFAKLFITAIY